MTRRVTRPTDCLADLLFATMRAESSLRTSRHGEAADLVHTAVLIVKQAFAVTTRDVVERKRARKGAA